MLYPLTFHPIFKERIWGGRNLERLYEKPLPPNTPIGESWEISDRPGDASVIANGILAGKNLHWLMRHHAGQLLGEARPRGGDFPLLIKILDAQEKLSLQVHPPAPVAAQLGGEPKTEMWFIAHATPEAELFVGLKRGVTREEFARKVKDGSVAECFHRVPVKSGDAMFLPSGRVHAIGAGNVIFEIQQNSDTTYRVFDWNRRDAAGKPRELHIEPSLQSIDFEDFEPELVPDADIPSAVGRFRPLARDPLFSVDLCDLMAGERLPARKGEMEIVGVVDGTLSVEHPTGTIKLQPGQFCLIPASVNDAELKASTDVRFLDVR